MSQVLETPGVLETLFTSGFNQRWAEHVLAGISRRSVSLAGGAIVTSLLLFTMRGLIAEDFVPQDVREIEAFEINPKIIEPPIIEILEAPTMREDIEVPPAPPPVDIPSTAKPTEPIVETGERPDLKLPTIPINVFEPIIMDADPAPLVRVPPAMPVRATKSGHCQISFDISADGRPYNILALSCSERLFSRPAVRSVEKWVYKPEIRDGQAITRTGLKTIIRFQLTDDGGRMIPE